jgi:heat shock protein HslJ
MACLDPILNQETAYFTALESASQWGYLIGNLRISYMTGDQVFKSLIFEPMSADEAAAAAPAEEAMSESEPGTLDQLTANTWQWVSFTDPGQQFDVESPENYTMTIMPDGNIELVADCNNATASYTVNDGGSITVEPGITTLALCPGESRSEEFLQKLGAAAIYFFQDGNLFIDLFADGGTMEFSPV